MSYHRCDVPEHEQLERAAQERDCLLEVMSTAYRWAKTGVGTFYDALAELHHHAYPADERDESVDVDALRALQARYRAEMNGPAR